MLMKKLMLQVLMFAMTIMASVSCSKDAYDPGKKEEDAREIYNRNFLAYVNNKIDSRVDWGFGAAKAGTRGQEDGYYLDDIYADYFYTAYYEKAVELLPFNKKVVESDVVKNNYELRSKGDTYFDIFFSDTDQEIEIGYYYYNPDNQTVKDRKEVKLVNGFATDQKNLAYFQYLNSQDRWVTPASTMGARVWTVSNQVHCRQFHVEPQNIPAGYHFGFYFKNPNNPDVKVYTNKYLNPEEQSFFAIIDGPKVKNSELSESYVIGMEDVTSTSTDFDCNDVMIAVVVANEPRVTLPDIIVPEKPKPEPVWCRVIAEDLNAHDFNGDNASDETDFDFNDIVLDVALTEDGKAKCILQAAGATLKIRIAGRDDLEVHKMFKVEQHIMVNTNADKKGLPYKNNMPPVEFELPGPYTSVGQVKLEVYKQNMWMELLADQAQPACKILVDQGFEWPDERESIKIKYPKFLPYVNNNEYVGTWWKK